MKKYIAIIIVLFLSSCCKPILETCELLKNTTNDEIEIRIYTNDALTSIIIAPKSVEQANFNQSNFASFADSAEVYVKGVYQQTHYGHTIDKIPESDKVLAFQNPKNLLNHNNFQMTRESLPCDGSRSTYTYSF
jgi:hypothetical protein